MLCFRLSGRGDGFRGPAAASTWGSRRPRVAGTSSTRATRLGVRAQRCSRVTTHARNASVLVTQAPRTSQVFGRCDAGNRVGPQYLCAQNKGTYTASIFAGLSCETLQFLRDRCTRATRAWPSTRRWKTRPSRTSRGPRRSRSARSAGRRAGPSCPTRCAAARLSPLISPSPSPDAPVT